MKVYKLLKASCASDAYFFTNTSSMPIGLLDKEAGLDGRIVGFHFYNPPAVQKLVEIIRSQATRPDIVAAASRSARPPQDPHPGERHRRLHRQRPLHPRRPARPRGGRAAREDARVRPGALYMVNRVSQDWLVRPMGIFQLIDYVGIDVFKFIQDVMDRFLDGEKLHSDLVDELIERGVLGGQNADGCQKHGLLPLREGQATAVYDLEKGAYRRWIPPGPAPLDRRSGALPGGAARLEDVSAATATRMRSSPPTSRRSQDRHAGGAARGSALEALEARSRRQLVDERGAPRPEDVNGVLTNGFFHLYGPINDYVCRPH